MSTTVTRSYSNGMPKVGPLLLYLAALAGGTYAAFQPTFDSGFAHMQADPGDTVLNHYLLEHTWRAVADPGYRGTLWSPPMFHPEPLTLAYSENFLGVAPAYWALRLALPYDLAYQWWMIGLTAANFAAFAAAARRVGLPHVLAAAGGYVWAFGLVHLEQLRHQQMIPRFWFPVAAYYAWRFATAPAGRSLHRAAGAVALQTAACIYTGWFLAVGVGVFAAAALTLEPGGWRRARAFAAANRGMVALTLGGWGLVVAALAAPYVAVNHRGGRAYADVIRHMPTPSAWLASPPGGRWYETVRPFREGVDEECTLFSGFGGLAVAAAGVVAARRLAGSPAWAGPARLAGAAAATAGLLVALTTDWSDGRGVSGWSVLRLLPGGTGLRVVSRVYTDVYLFATLGGLVGVWALAETGLRAARARRAVYAGVAAVLVFEQTGYTPPSFPKADFYPAAGRCGAALCGADAGYVPLTWGRIPEHGDLLGMWAGLFANVPVVNGYSGRLPDGYPPKLVLTDAELRAWLGPAFRGRLAVIDPTTDPPAVRYLDFE